MIVASFIALFFFVSALFSSQYAISLYTLNFRFSISKNLNILVPNQKFSITYINIYYLEPKTHQVS